MFVCKGWEGTGEAWGGAVRAEGIHVAPCVGV